MDGENLFKGVCAISGALAGLVLRDYSRRLGVLETKQGKTDDAIQALTLAVNDLTSELRHLRESRVVCPVAPAE